MPRLDVGTELKTCMCRPISVGSLRRMYTLLAQYLYSDSDHFGEEHGENLKCLTFNPDEPERSELFVGLAHSFSPSNETQRPAVYVGTENLSLVRVAMNNSSGRSQDNAVEHFAQRATLTTRISHVHTDGDIAIALAEISLMFFSGTRLLIQERLMSSGLLRYEIKGIEPPKKTSGKPDTYFREDLIIETEWQYTVSISRESHRLKKFAQIISPV